MSDEATIKFNYDQAIKQAGELEKIAKEVKKVATGSLTDSLATVDKNWDGANSVKFIKKGNMLKEKVSDSAEDIGKIASTIRTIAKQIYDAEMEALRIAKERAAAGK